MPQALVVDSTWVSHPEEHFTQNLPGQTLMSKPLGTPVPPYESYTSNQPTMPIYPFPVLEMPLSPHPIAEPGAEGRSQEVLCRSCSAVL